MEVKFIPSKEVNSDLGVVNAARVSLKKKSKLRHNGEAFFFCDLNDCQNLNHYVLKDEDTKLINYLQKHNHWTPFAHSRLYLELHKLSGNDRLYFYEHAEQSGFNLIKSNGVWWLKGSLYSFLKNLEGFKNIQRQDYITDIVLNKYPISGCAFGLRINNYPNFNYFSNTLVCEEEWIYNEAREHPELYKILTATLYIKVPIFIARQIRTSRIGFACSDYYVESEAFVFNEVSRRYVNDEPEFYFIHQWRVREGKTIKQGSTGYLFNQDLYSMIMNDQEEIIENSSIAYNGYSRREDAPVAPEQLRALLPQSMYTEFYMTGSIHRWMQFLELRLQPDVQYETRQIASQIGSELMIEYPSISKHYPEVTRLISDFNKTI